MMKHISRLALVPCSMAGILLSVSAAKAIDFEVDSATTTVNGGNILTGSDNLTITPSGSITVTAGHGIDDGAGTGGTHFIDVSGQLTIAPGDGGDGIDMDDVATIGVSGTIDVSGTNGNGIDVNDDSSVTVTSSGQVTTHGDDGNTIEADDNDIIAVQGTLTANGRNSSGISAIDNNKISVTGQITTHGRRGHAIDVYDDNTIAINGAVTTFGDRADAINAVDDNVISVSGQLTTNGLRTDAISVLDNNQISVSGAIKTNATDAYGLYMEYDNTVDISGNIEVIGTSSTAVNAWGSGNTITVSGRVVSALDNSFLIEDTENTLNLNAPAFLAGDIAFRDLVTVNVKTGPSHSIYWDFLTGPTSLDFPTGYLAGSAPTVTGPVPGFWNGTTQTLATYDPTRFAASFEVLADLTRRLSLGLPGFVRENVGNRASAFSSSHGEDVQAEASNKNGIWMRLDAGFWSHDGDNATLDRDSSMVSISAGAQLYESDVVQLGATVGALSSQLNADSRFARSYENELWGGFGGFYGNAQFDSGTFASFSALGGWLSHSDSRYVNNNLATSGGVYTGASHARSDYNSWWVSPSLRVGHHFDLGNGLTITPSVQARYASQWIDDISETGSSANAKISASQISTSEAAFDVKIEKAFKTASFAAQFGVQHSQRFGGDDHADVALNGHQQAVNMFQRDQSSLYVGISASTSVSENSDFSFDTRADFSQTSLGIGGSIAYNLRF